MKDFSLTVLRNSAFGMAAQLAIKVLSFGFSVLIIRHLGAETFGQSAAVLAFAGMFVFGIVMAMLGAVLPALSSRLSFSLAAIGTLAIIPGVLLSLVLADFLPGPNFAITQPQHGYHVFPAGAGQARSSEASVLQNVPDPQLIHSITVPLALKTSDGA